jgi:hypothetical protein
MWSKNYRICFHVILFIFLLVPKNLKSQLKDPDNKADYIIIYSNQFIETLQPFIQWRGDQDLLVMPIGIDQIYTEFPDSSTKPQSIREFISFALQFWQDPKPQYVLLVGDTEYIPSYRMESSIENEDSIAIDELYTINLYESDTKSDVALGRLPVSNTDQLANIIKKTMLFEEGFISDNWMNNFIFLADSNDNPKYPGCFENSVKNFINNNLTEYFYPVRIDINEVSPFYGTRQDLFNALNSGALFFSYYGHGDPIVWSRYHYFTINDIDSLVESNKFFILSAAACSQNFDNPNQVTIVEKLLFFPNGGAVSTIASSGINSLGTGEVFLRYFYDQVFENHQQSIGKTILKVKQFINQISKDLPLDHQYRRFTLLGDPCLKIPFHLFINIEMEDHKFDYQFSLHQNYPNPFNRSTIISYQLKKDSFVLLKIYDLKGKLIYVLVNQWQDAGKYKLKFIPNNISSGVYLYQITADNFQLTRKFIYIK